MVLGPLVLVGGGAGLCELLTLLGWVVPFVLTQGSHLCPGRMWALLTAGLRQNSQNRIPRVNRRKLWGLTSNYACPGPPQGEEEGVAEYCGAHLSWDWRGDLLSPHLNAWQSFLLLLPSFLLSSSFSVHLS